jgi:hypothetical protein
LTPASATTRIEKGRASESRGLWENRLFVVAAVQLPKHLLTLFSRSRLALLSLALEKGRASESRGLLEDRLFVVAAVQLPKHLLTSFQLTTSHHALR